jgi:hypothetical protein
MTELIRFAQGYSSACARMESYQIAQINLLFSFVGTDLISVCRKTFNMKSYDTSLNKHENGRIGYDCYGTFGTYVRTKS